jgi:hypothetical protein
MLLYYFIRSKSSINRGQRDAQLFPLCMYPSFCSLCHFIVSAVYLYQSMTVSNIAPSVSMCAYQLAVFWCLCLSVNVAEKKELQLSTTTMAAEIGAPPTDAMGGRNDGDLDVQSIVIDNGSCTQPATRDTLMPIH